MSRLIDADAIIIDLLDRGIEGVQTDDYAEFQQIIDNAPTVDAVPVVRCGECRKCATDECYFFAHGDWGMSGPDWDFFCADGERKGGDE